MKYKVVPIAKKHVEGFNAAVGNVARERKYLGWLDAPPLDESRKFVLENIRDGWPQYVALINDEVIGWCDITSKGRPVFEHSGVLGMGIVAPYRDKGIGKALMAATLAAARAKGLTRIELIVREGNERAIALYKNMGFVIEGVKRHNTYLDGKYENDLMMAVLFE